MARVRERLGYSSVADFARACGVAQQTYYQWESRNSAPSSFTIKRALKRLGVSGASDLLSWIADGEDAPPAWLEDESLDPYASPTLDGTPPGGGGGGPVVPAMPWSLLVERVAPALRKVAARELSGSEGASCDLEFVELATEFERWLRSFAPRRSTQISGEGAAPGSRSNLLKSLAAAQTTRLVIGQTIPLALDAA